MSDLIWSIHCFQRLSADNSRGQRVTQKSNLLSVFTVNGLKFQTLFSFSSHYKMLVIGTGIHKMLGRIANGEEPDLFV